MSTECYAMVRGSALRVTGLSPCGSVPDPIPSAVSKSVSRVEINEVTEAGSNELLRNDVEEPRLHFVRSEETVRYTADISFLRVDPGILSLVSGVPLVYGPGGGYGFGEGPFGETPFGVGGSAVVGFDADLRVPATAFAMEVWSNLSGANCADGQRRYGYTLFPYLRGGVLSGFQFANGLVSFTLLGAQTRRGSKWGIGPYDLEGPWARLTSEVSGNTSWRTFVTTSAPPEQSDGIVWFRDIIDNGDADHVSSDIIDGQTVITSSDIIEGGSAA